MSHQCVRCGALYSDDAKEILSGCSSCSGKLFFYVRAGKVAQAKTAIARMTPSAKEKLREDVADFVGHDVDAEGSVVLDLETINILEDGTYEIDLKQLMDPSKPVIYKMREGTYLIDLAETMERFAKNK